MTEETNTATDAWRSKLMSLDVRVPDASKQLITQLKDALQCDRATFFRVDHEKGEVYSVAATALEIAEIRLPMRRGVVGFVARTGRTLNLKDVYNDPRFDRTTDQKTGYRSKSMLTMAVREADGTVVGVLQALNKRTDLFLPNDEAVMARFCQEALKVIHART
jgi:adenylate cyclase